MAFVEDDPGNGKISRRKLFEGVGLFGVVAAVAAPEGGSSSQCVQPAASPPTGGHFEARETLTAAEADLLEAIVARLIPADETGPGALEAGAVAYIDRALAGALRGGRDSYAANLAAVDAHARTRYQKGFATLTSDQQDMLLGEIQANKADGFMPDSASFFEMLRSHTIQGTFCDPYYGGNAGFIGWDMIRYPGIRVSVSESEQRLVAPSPVHESAYGSGMGSGGHAHKP